MSTQVEVQPQTLTFDDLHVGQRFLSAQRTITAEEIKAFARIYDPQTFHMDEVAAVDTFFNGLAASGWHTAAITMRLMVEAFPIAGGVVGAGGELQWPRPTRPGDTLRVEVEILELTPSRSRPDRGSAIVRMTTLNQLGEAVQIFTVRMPMPRRVAGA